MVQTPLPPGENQASNPPASDLKQWLESLADRIVAGEFIDRETAIALTKIEGEDQMIVLGRSGVGPQQHIEKSLKDSEKH